MAKNIPLLLHACCAPCSLEPVRLLMEEGFDPHICWTNPNIQPMDEHDRRLGELRRWCARGRLAVFTTQVPHEGCDLAVYEVGRAVGELPGVLEARDMTPEAVAVKLMWALGQTEDREKAARLFETPIEYDIM